VRFLERGQSDEERLKFFREREKTKRGRILGEVVAQLEVAWARITEKELDTPLEPGDIRGELAGDQHRGQQ